MERGESKDNFFPFEVHEDGVTLARPEAEIILRNLPDTAHFTRNLFAKYLFEDLDDALQENPDCEHITIALYHADEMIRYYRSPYVEFEEYGRDIVERLPLAARLGADFPRALAARRKTAQEETP